MNHCSRCGREGANRLIDKYFCNKCFCRLIEQKIRHNLRAYHLPKDVKLYPANNPLTEYILGRIINMPFVTVKSEKKAKYTVIPWTLDDEIEAFLARIIYGKKQKSVKNTIKLFLEISKDDLQAYCRIKRLECNIQKTEINLQMDEFEKKHPGTKNALLRSIKSLESVSE